MREFIISKCPPPGECAPPTGKAKPVEGTPPLAAETPEVGVPPAAEMPVVELPPAAETPVVGVLPAAETPVAEVPPGERTERTRLKAQPKQRDFIIQYDGRFIGHYHSRRPVLSRIAFGQVARELRAQIPEFDPERLALFRPVKLRIQSQTGAEVAAAGGEFVWFGGK